MIQPSLLERTTTGSPSSFGSKTLWQETKKLFPSIKAKTATKKPPWIIVTKIKGNSGKNVSKMNGEKVLYKKKGISGEIP